MTIRTVAEINEKIKKGTVKVATASEMVKLVKSEGVKNAAQQIDVVTSGIFAPVCSAGLFLSVPQPRPRIKSHRAWLNGVPAYCGLGHSEMMISAGEPWESDPLNRVYPGEFKYGGGHVIEDLCAKEEVHLMIEAYGTKCHPRQSVNKVITIDEFPSTVLFCPCAALETRPCAVNVSDNTIYTFLGSVRPRLGNAAYSSAGELAPLNKDPNMRVIGPGTRIFLGGTEGTIVGKGLRYCEDADYTEQGLPLDPARSLMMVGDLKNMSKKYIVGISLTGYGPGLAVGIGVPIPIIDEQAAFYAGISDDEIILKVVDFSNDFPANSSRIMGKATMTELLSGTIKVRDQEVPTIPVGSRIRSVEICDELKGWIKRGEFLLGECTGGLQV